MGFSQGVRKACSHMHRAFQHLAASGADRYVRQRQLLHALGAAVVRNTIGRQLGDEIKVVRASRRAYATNVQSASIPGVGHWVAEQAPREMVALFTELLTHHEVAWI